jgi:hypothetical protein
MVSRVNRVALENGSDLLLIQTRHGESVVSCHGTSGRTLHRRGRGGLSHEEQDDGRRAFEDECGSDEALSQMSQAKT